MTDPNHGTPRTAAALLDDLERYYDAVPRGSARAEDFGPLTLFVREDGGGPFYARPTRGVVTPPTPEQVQAVRSRQRELGLPQAFEWVAEVAPGLRAAVERAGLKVSEHPLLALSAEVPVEQDHVGGAAAVRVLDADDPDLPEAIAAQHLAFGTPGTALGAVGLPEQERETASRLADGTVDRSRARVRSGATVFAAALQDVHAVSAGQHNPVGAVSEIVGVATLPAYRRRGLGLAVTSALVADARAHAVSTVFLSAEDDDVARIYERLGFQRVGTALIAEG